MNPMSTVLFDLDGTLLDTLSDLAESVNVALTQNNLPVRTLDEVRLFVGNGVQALIQRAVPKQTAPTLEAQCLSDFKSHYLTHMEQKTAPYPGILALLDQLKDMGIKTAVVSNKFDGAVKCLCARYFGTLTAAVGELPGLPKKPAPDLVLKAMAEVHADPAATVYVGDSDVDIATAHNAGLPCISVTWGFRDRAFLATHGAALLIDRPEELLRILENRARHEPL